ncbi:MAG: ABC transporter permease [Candidatus Nanohaloarchaea archaeon]
MDAPGEVKRHLELYVKYFVIFWKTRLIYRTDFVLGFTAQLLNLVASLAFLTLIFTQVESIQGWTFNEMLFLAGFGGLVLNLHHIFFFSLYSLGDDYIITGRMDRFLVRPLHPLFQVFASKVSDDNLSKFLANIAVLMYAASQIGVNLLTPAKLFYGFFAILSGVMIFGSIFLALSSLGFWAGRSKPLFWFFFQISNFRKYPYGIYSVPIKIILVTLLPIAFAAFFPATFFLEKGSWGLWQLAALVAGPVFYLLAYQVWRVGLSTYSSTGS